MLEELTMLSSLVGGQRNKLIASCTLSVIGTALGLVPFVLIYLVILELSGTAADADQAYIWNLVIWSIAAILLRFGFMGLSGSLSHIAAYSILYDLRIKMAQKLGTLPLGYFNEKKRLFNILALGHYYPTNCPITLQPTSASQTTRHHRML